MQGTGPTKTIENPFIKTQNKIWTLAAPSSLQKRVSPPPPSSHRKRPVSPRPHTSPPRPKPNTPRAPAKSLSAAIEAGEVEVAEHVSFFSSKLLAARLPEALNDRHPRLQHEEWLELYRRHAEDGRGHHFVVHQHDHPIAGTHYDLRLQCNASSSISFAIMYGLPGDPNSKHLNRNATETRVHNLWNHLVETASPDTGTMLLWDTGEYFVLPYDAKRASGYSTDSAESASEPRASGSKDGGNGEREESEPQKLHRAFQARKIKLRLRGTKLPPNYTISLRLTKENYRATQPAPPSYKRRRNGDAAAANRKRQRRGQRPEVETSSDSSPAPSEHEAGSSNDAPAPAAAPTHLKHSVSSLRRLASPPPGRRKRRTTTSEGDDSVETITTTTPAMPDSVSSTTPSAPKPEPNHEHKPNLAAETDADADSDEQIRVHNAYPGATNSIGSVHQRKWFLSLDRAASRLRPEWDARTRRRRWVAVGHDDGDDNDKHEGPPPRDTPGAFTAFHVLGREHETSVLTGRKAADVARDEGLVGYRPRAGWRGITE